MARIEAGGGEGPALLADFHEMPAATIRGREQLVTVWRHVTEA